MKRLHCLSHDTPPPFCPPPPPVQRLLPRVPFLLSSLAALPQHPRKHKHFATLGSQEFGSNLHQPLRTRGRKGRRENSRDLSLVFSPADKRQQPLSLSGRSFHAFENVFVQRRGRETNRRIPGHFSLSVFTDFTNETGHEPGSKEIPRGSRLPVEINALSLYSRGEIEVTPVAPGL